MLDAHAVVYSLGQGGGMMSDEVKPVSVQHCQHNHVNTQSRHARIQS